MSDEPRPAHGSALGHGIGLGGNGLLWALGTYGWGIAAAIGGVFSLFALGSMAKRRRSSRRGGAGGRTGGGKGLGGGLRGLLGGKRGGGKGGGRSGLGGKGSKSGKGGFLQRMKERRSTSPNGRGGIPGRGGAPKGAGKGKGLLGAGRPGHTPSGSSSKRGGKGSNRPGGRNRSRSNSPGSRQRTRNRTPGGGRLRNLFGGGGRNRDKTKRPNAATKNRGKSRARNAVATVCGPSKDWLERRRKAWLDRRRNKAKKNPEKATGWEEAPTWKKGTKMTEAAPTTPKAPARRTVRKAPSPRAATTGASALTGGGHFTAGAEQYAQALSKPAGPVDTLKGMDRALADLGESMTVVGNGVKNFGTVMEDAMPDEGALHEQLGQYAAQLAQIAEGVALMRADQHRRTAADHERIDNNRKNEQGYDFTKNQE